jgi:hypothetical protein
VIADGAPAMALTCVVRGAAGGKPMSIDAEEAAIRTVIVSALMGTLKPATRLRCPLLQCGKRRQS